LGFGALGVADRDFRSFPLPIEGCGWGADVETSRMVAMMILSETSPIIRTTAEQVFAFFAAMESNYGRWHADHVLFRWLDPPAVKKGVRFYFEERIGGKLLKKTVAFTRIEPGALIEFAPTSRLFRLFLPRISFRIRQANGGIVVTQDIYLRIGPLAARLNRRELDAVRLHMRQEGENMRRLLG
jgi:hypothetical protein